MLTSKVKASAVSIATDVSPVPGELKEVILKPILFGSDFPTRLSVSEAVPPLAAAFDKENESMVKDYYHVMNNLCAIGECEKMYVPPVMREDASLYCKN